jgi:hypothetical protein
LTKDQFQAKMKKCRERLRCIKGIERTVIVTNIRSRC